MLIRVEGSNRSTMFPGVIGIVVASPFTGPGTNRTWDPACTDT